VPADLMTWAQWFENSDRTVAKTQIGESEVSTVFIGLDHSFGEGPLQLFETIVFDGPLADEMVRYSTWEEAEKGHKVMVDRVKTHE